MNASHYTLVVFRLTDVSDQLVPAWRQPRLLYIYAGKLLPRLQAILSFGFSVELPAVPCLTTTLSTVFSAYEPLPRLRRRLVLLSFGHSLELPAVASLAITLATLFGACEPLPTSCSGVSCVHLSSILLYKGYERARNEMLRGRR